MLNNYADCLISSTPRLEDRILINDGLVSHEDRPGRLVDEENDFLSSDD